MSVNLHRNQVSRLLQEIARLRADDAREAQKEARANSEINRNNESARRASSASTAQMYLRNVEKCLADLARIADSRARLADQLSRKTGDLHRAQDQLRNTEDREYEKTKRDRDNFTKSLERKQAELDRDLQKKISQVETMIADENGMELLQYDLFLSHASEDKPDFVESFYAELTGQNLKVWYDDEMIKWGDSLRRSIDRGLSKSRFGLVVLSEHFFQKEWPQRELDGLVALEDDGNSRIFPVWHNISKDRIAKFSPMLADRIALNTATHTAREMAQKLRDLIKHDEDKAASLDQVSAA